MRDGYRIHDADCHVLEPDGMWARGLPAKLRDRAPRWVTRKNAKGKPRSSFEIEGEEVLARCSTAVQDEASRVTEGRFADELVDGAIPPQAELRALDRMGVDVAHLYPTVALQLMGIEALEPVLAAALARAYNDWMWEFSRTDPLRLRPVAILSRHDPKAMLRELRRVISTGFRAVVVRPNLTCGRRLSDPAHEPVWRELAGHGVALALHEGAHARVATAGADRFRTRFGLHACSHPMEQMMAFLDLLEGGVLERHPDLRVGFLEAGAGWLPYWLWRLDEVEYKNLAWEVRAAVRERPSHYFRRQCFVSVEPTEPGLAEVVRAVGADRLLFGSDYPHMDHDADVVSHAVGLAAVLGEGVTRRILWESPELFYSG